MTSVCAWARIYVCACVSVRRCRCVLDISFASISKYSFAFTTWFISSLARLTEFRINVKCIPSKLACVSAGLICFSTWPIATFYRVSHSHISSSTHAIRQFKQHVQWKHKQNQRKSARKEKKHRQANNCTSWQPIALTLSLSLCLSFWFLLSSIWPAYALNMQSVKRNCQQIVKQSWR